MKKHKIVFIGATGAVGSAAFNQLLKDRHVSKILTLGRRIVQLQDPPTHLEQQIIDIHNPASYTDYIDDYQIAICTLGVGEPSSISKKDFIAIDKTAVLNFCERV